MDTNWIDDRDRFWIDHPKASEEADGTEERTPGRTPKRVRFEDDSPVPSPSPTTSINPNAGTPISSPEEAIENPDLGGSADGKSCRLKHRYGCTLGDKQIPLWWFKLCINVISPANKVNIASKRRRSAVLLRS
jgi:hypothetical protein